MGRSGKANYMCTNVGRLDASMCKLSYHCFYLLSEIENIVISWKWEWIIGREIKRSWRLQLRAKSTFPLPDLVIEECGKGFELTLEVAVYSEENLRFQ